MKGVKRLGVVRENISPDIRNKAILAEISAVIIFQLVASTSAVLKPLDVLILPPKDNMELTQSLFEYRCRHSSYPSVNALFLTTSIRDLVVLLFFLFSTFVSPQF